MMVRRILFVFLTAVASVLGGLAAAPAMADSVITSSFDTDVAHLGDTVTLHVTFTNPESVDVTFTYLTANQTYISMQAGVRATETGCTGEISSCDHYTVPIAPGATRTVTLTYEIATDSSCGEGRPLEFYFYNYRESSAGAVDLLAWSPAVTVLC
ncbi:MAG TPA: hypothetical protein VF069_26110 [Streptosporangiaceae bacterium]